MGWKWEKKENAGAGLPRENLNEVCTVILRKIELCFTECYCWITCFELHVVHWTATVQKIVRAKALICLTGTVAFTSFNWPRANLCTDQTSTTLVVLSFGGDWKCPFPQCVTSLWVPSWYQCVFLIFFLRTVPFFLDVIANHM